jgi:alkylation response protein AidB-like acyl-CoA dehydrogenase
MSTLSFERGTAFTHSQMMLAKAVDDLVARAKARAGLHGASGFADSDIGRRLTLLRAETAALRAMTYLAVSKNLRRNAPGPDGSMLKIVLPRLQQEAQRIALELIGSDVIAMNSVTREYLRGFANSVAGGTDEIQHTIVAERVLGLPRQR